jgi:pimeloyl-ACP methyl ester carboxylesterase
MTMWYDPQPDSRFAPVDGLRVRYKCAGRGAAVVLLHGSASSLHGFERVAALLSASFDVVRLDLPGFGLTGPRADCDYRIGTYASTLARFISVLGVPHYALVGHSLDGNIALNLALDHPERIDGLVLINATGYPGKSLPAGLRLARNPLLRPLLRRWLPRRATERSLRSAVGSRSTIVDDAMVDRVHTLMSRPGIGPAGLARPAVSLHWLLRNDQLAGFVAKRFGRRLLERHLGHNVRDPGRATELAAMIRDAYRYEGSMYAFFATLQNFRLSDRAELYRRTRTLGVPTMLVWGADDHVTPIDRLDIARALLQPLQCHVIEACGHMVPLERPRDVADKIASFVACCAERHDS